MVIFALSLRGARCHSVIIEEHIEHGCLGRVIDSAQKPLQYQHYRVRPHKRDEGLKPPAASQVGALWMTAPSDELPVRLSH